MLNTSKGRGKRQINAEKARGDLVSELSAAI